MTIIYILFIILLKLERLCDIKTDTVIILNRIGDWFLECKYNPSYRYCRCRLDKEFNESEKEYNRLFCN